MSEPVSATAVATTAAGIGQEEARSVLATLIGQILSMVKAIVMWMFDTFKSIMAWSGEHPEAFFLIMGNLVIWFS